VIRGHAPRALIISHEDASGGGLVENRLRERGVEIDVHVVVPDRNRPDLPAPFPDLDAYDLIVPMGSYWSVHDDATIGSWIHEEIELLRRTHERGIPVLGICFGGQALAAALGGSVEPAPRTELGWFTIRAEAGPLPIPDGPWLEWHHDRFTPPPHGELLASTPDAPQLFRQDHSVGTQFHPEINVDLVDEWLEGATDEYLASHGVTRDGIRESVAVHETANRVNCAALVDWFLDDVARLPGLATVDAETSTP
jgi:GMP synthase-like glutamine amidotransferase